MEERTRAGVLREVVEFQGVRYYRYPESPRPADRRYFKRGGEHLHAAIWQAAGGEIPPGCLIHHRDGNPLNNDVANLECRTPKEHGAIHAALSSPEQRQAKRDHWDRVRQSASDWHRSPEGREWHRLQGERAWEGRESKTYRCECCLKPFQSRAAGPVRFCGPNCRSEQRRRDGTDNEERTCAHCGQPFIVNRFSRIRSCSQRCGARLRAKERKSAARKETTTMVIKVGETVYLKSGSPPMTVTGVTDTHVTCTWQQQRGELARESFSLGVLTKDRPGRETETFRDHGDWLQNVAEKATTGD